MSPRFVFNSPINNKPYLVQQQAIIWTNDSLVKWCIYRQVSNKRRTLVSNYIVDYSDVIGASPVGAAPTPSSLSTWHLASKGWAKTTGRRDENHLSFVIWCFLYQRFRSMCHSASMCHVTSEIVISLLVSIFSQLDSSTTMWGGSWVWWGVIEISSTFQYYYMKKGVLSLLNLISSLIRDTAIIMREILQKKVLSWMESYAGPLTVCFDKRPILQSRQ